MTRPSHAFVWRGCRSCLQCPASGAACSHRSALSHGSTLCPRVAPLGQAQTCARTRGTYMGLYEFGQWTGEKAAAVNAKIDAFNGAVKDANANADLTFASLINATADGFNVALERTIPAFLGGRTMEGGAGVREMVESLSA